MRQTAAPGFSLPGDRLIIEESISRLLEVGVRRIVIVTGHVVGELVGISKISQTLYRVMLQESVERFHTTRTWTTRPIAWWRQPASPP